MPDRLAASPWGPWRWYWKDRKMADIARIETSAAMHPHRMICTPLMLPLKMTVKLGAAAARCDGSGRTSVV
jgi:hypothetical protein